MLRPRSLFTSSFALCLAFGAGACLDLESPETGEEAERSGSLGQNLVPPFDVADYEAELASRLDGKVVGYAFVVYKYGVEIGSGQGGSAVLEDGNTVFADVPHGPDQTQDTFSTSKTVTATAILKALEDSGGAVTLGSKLVDYLPSNWNKSNPLSAQLTLRDVLTHATGLQPVNTGVAGETPCSFAALKKSIQNGPNLNLFHRGDYQSINSCLLRIALPYIVAGPAALQWYETQGTVDSFTANFYVSFVKQKLFAKVGITGDVVPTGPAPYTRYYNFDDTTKYQKDPTDAAWVSRDSGASYWNLSAREYARFIDGLFSYKMLGSSMVNAMINTQSPDPNNSSTRLGMWAETYATALGTQVHYHHNGGPGAVAGAGASTVWWRFPGGITVVLFVNSIGSPMVIAEPTAQNAYWAAVDLLPLD